ncbi:zinc-binding dehydrogenase [Halanaerobium sp. MA284_MarDTE_T2]|uniref:zinc-dependent alcohol dehydrogenase n=1 Tax=Halanaerobium sp. MA284_MarDTE_T2 TaxID=2183913 RepID=UPI000DF2645F|nr:zinc-binding dehydrogenase [Halanaerobium sp. MA284_MarDTE_T2]RCW48638.1 L-iditol 2-dehydrogenase [Halanaerobium sp. MA284_MarDTE_T2]
MKTRVAKLANEGEIYLVEKELNIEKNDVLVKTEQASICGTDKMFYKGELPPEEDYPLLLGHEGGGEVINIGKGVSKYRPGDKVISFGHYHTFSDYFVIKEKYLQPVPEGMNMRYAALGEPIACALYSSLNSGVNLGDNVLVLGLGFAGQILAQGSKLKGANKVVGVDVVKGKLSLAKKLGTDIVFNFNDENINQKLMDITNGEGFDVVIEAAGTEESMNMASDLVKHNGIISLYSWITEPVTLDIHRWHHHSLYIRNTGLVHHTPEERYVWAPKALRPVQQGLIDIESLISDEYKLEEIEKAFQAVSNDNNLIKVLIKP